MRSRRVLGVGALLSTLGVLGCLVVPVYSGGDGARSATLLAVNGAGALLPLGLFLGLAVGAWLAPWGPARWVLVAGHAGLTALAVLTIGVFFLPATLALVLGAALELRTPRPAGVGPAAASA